ncbi:efflux transporter outer membrane subunit [Castellaniella sp. GW247-6E4]|uniref:efflux transporter outer membrane subunit n=1 Tax=Castellaniella sp. GW247-6E4 TaxID=3140380 RepID=UPI0033147473
MRARSLAGRVRAAILAGACGLLAACASGPDYQRPALDIGTAYRHAPEGQWRRAQPGGAALAADWWRLFGDADLGALMASLNRDNLDIARAEAQYRQARATLDRARAGLFPTVGASGTYERAGRGNATADNPSNEYGVSMSVSWEVDLWGKVRRGIEAGRAGLGAGAADLAAARLSMQSTLAQTYFAVRANEAQAALLDRTVEEYERALRMTRNRYAAGVASSADVAAASAQLDNARTQRIRLGWQGEQQVNAVAVLLGRTPASFTMPAGAGVPKVPTVPAGIPSTLLERRPDVAASERRAAEANAQIGVAEAAWFPDLTLGAQAGYRAAEFVDWLSAPARFWTLGPTLALTLFDGGARRADVESARAGYDAQAAAYRQTVLDAVREVEDALAQTDAMVREQATQARALEAARETLRQITNQYQAGLVDYLSVVQAQTSALSAEQSALDLRAQRLQATVQLVAALGGGWEGLPRPLPPDDDPLASGSEP